MQIEAPISVQAAGPAVVVVVEVEAVEPEAEAEGCVASHVDAQTTAPEAKKAPAEAVALMLVDDQHFPTV